MLTKQAHLVFLGPQALGELLTQQEASAGFPRLKLSVATTPLLPSTALGGHTVLAAGLESVEERRR